MQLSIVLTLLALTLAASLPSKTSLKSPPAAPVLTRGGASSVLENTPTDMALAGAIATMIGDLSMHPMDCIKTMQQSTAGAGLSMLGASQSILKAQGIAGFYSGAGTYVITDGLAGSLKFATYEFLKKKWDRRVENTTDPAKRKSMERWGVFAIAGVAFIASSVVLVPGELIKQRLQLGQINSVGGGVSTILKNEGFFGLFTGYSAVCFRDVPYTMMELGVYDNLKRAYLKFKRGRSTEEQKITTADEMVCAALTGGLVGYLSNPLDIVKTKMMTDAAYGGLWDACKQQVGTYGVGSLFQGGAARVAWLMPFTAIYLPVYEEIKRKLLQARGGGGQVAGVGRGGGGWQPPSRAQTAQRRPGVCYF